MEGRERERGWRAAARGRRRRVHLGSLRSDREFTGCI
jgi:hypothetical protein